jgi:hypothetical protein
MDKFSLFLEEMTKYDGLKPFFMEVAHLVELKDYKS